MGVYNVKIVDYPGSKGSTKIVKYSKPVVYGYKKGDLTPEEKEEKAALYALRKENQSAEDAEKAARHSMQVSLNRTKNTIYDLAKSNNWEWFLTFTFDPKRYDNTDYDVVTKLFKRFIDRIRKSDAPSLVYLVVPELHADGKKWHLHGLLSNTQWMEFRNSGCKGSDGETIYNLKNWTYGFSTATQIKDPVRASAYITKYITKDVVLHTKNKRRYFASKNISRPQVTKINSPNSLIDIMKTYEPDFVKSVSVPAAGRKITYMEIDD